MRPTPVAMYTHERRSQHLPDTIRAWEAAGVPITHIQHQTSHPSSARNRQNAHDAMRHTMKHHRRGRGLLMIEDDTTPNGHMPAWLRHIEDSDYQGIISLYTPNRQTRYAPKHLHGIMAGLERATVGEIFRAPTPRGWWGAQALWIPWDVCDLIENDPRFRSEDLGIGPWDTALRTVMMERSIPLYFTAPSIVQHAGGANLVAPHRTRHASASYDYDVTPPTRPHRRPAEEKEPCHKARAD